MNNYPRDLHVDFSKLRKNTLKRYAWYYNVDSKTTGRVDLACACANHFLSDLDVDEGMVLQNFVDYCSTSGPSALKRLGLNASRGNGVNNKHGSSSSSISSGDDASSETKRRRFDIIEDDKLVVAKVNDLWILTRVLKFNKRTRRYKVEDADELAKVRQTFDVGPEDVIPLPTEEEVYSNKPFAKGTRVLAKFPKTSSFYAATVALYFPKKYEYGLRFDDDERDEYGMIRVVKCDALEVVEEP